MSKTKSECIGFRLLKRYPGCSKQVGDFEQYTTGEFFRYPEIWEPVYKDSSKKEGGRFQTMIFKITRPA